MKRFIPHLLCLALLAGCAASSDDASRLPAAPVGISKAHAVDAEWWKAYRQDALDRTVDLALRRNVDLAKAAIDVNKALCQANLVGADLFPSFSADASAKSKRDVSRHAGSTRTFGGSVGLSYELDLWRRVSSAASAKEWELKATEHDLKAARLALVNSVTDAWFRIKYLRRALAMDRESERRCERLHALATARYRAGKAASIDPLQTRQTLLTARGRVVSAEADLAEALAAMRDLLNLAPGETFPENGTDLHAIAGVAPDLDVPVSALSARPDVAAAEARLNGMFSSLKATERAWFPTITLGGTLEVSSEKRTTLFDVPFLSGLVKVSFPFMDWNRLRWQTGSAQADVEDARMTFVKTVTTAVNEVDTAYVLYRAAVATLGNALAKSAADAKAAAYHRARYRAGAEELKDALEALNTAASSATTALEAKYKALAAEHAVYKAMGGRVLSGG